MEEYGWLFEKLGEIVFLPEVDILELLACSTSLLSYIGARLENLQDGEAL